MQIDDYLERVAVIGAAGKMGGGISLLLAWEMAKLKSRTENRGRSYRLTLIDVQQARLTDLLGYIENQSLKYARRNIEAIRPLYQVREEEQIVNAFVADTLAVIHTHTDYRQAQNARLIFEVTPEVERLKVEILGKLNQMCSDDAFFLSNTSSIPIRFLDEAAGLEGRIVGFHFYNPPAVQKLIELITPLSTRAELSALAAEIAQRLGKTPVASRDTAGFIGNGHFIRDGLHALSEVGKLRSRFDLHEAIYAVNRISQDGLVRPMGIFQLVDYVGLDVCASILRVMRRHIDGEVFTADLIDAMVSRGILGGQDPDGSQKDGFFRYRGRRPVCIYVPNQGSYLPLTDVSLHCVQRALGPLGEVNWRDLQRDPDSDRKLKDHFLELASSSTLGAQLTLAYLRASRRIGERLVTDGVAESSDDVNTVLITGFGHLYGAFNDYVS